MINIGNGEQKMVIDRRNCGRIIYDIAELASGIQRRVMPHLPQGFVTTTNKPGITGKGPVNETWRLTRFNEKLRILKYTSGMYFREHCDGSYVTEDGKEMSFLTIHLYLNGSDPTGRRMKQLPDGSREGEKKHTQGERKHRQGKL
jgi:hypothetical protein